MSEYLEIAGLRVARTLERLVAEEIAPGTGIEPDTVWNTLAEIVATLGPRNRELLARRDELQTRIDEWFGSRGDAPLDGDAYRAFLEEIGYLVPDGEPFTVTTANQSRYEAETPRRPNRR